HGWPVIWLVAERTLPGQHFLLFGQSSRERRMGVDQVGVDAFGAAIQCVLRRAHLDTTTTGALASGPARCAETPAEMPGRRPALHPSREIAGGCVPLRPV